MLITHRTHVHDCRLLLVRLPGVAPQRRCVGACSPQQTPPTASTTPAMRRTSIPAHGDGAAHLLPQVGGGCLWGMDGGRSALVRGSALSTCFWVRRPGMQPRRLVREALEPKFALLLQHPGGDTWTTGRRHASCAASTEQQLQACARLCRRCDLPISKQMIDISLAALLDHVRNSGAADPCTADSTSVVAVGYTQWVRGSMPQGPASQCHAVLGWAAKRMMVVQQPERGGAGVGGKMHDGCVTAGALQCWGGQQNARWLCNSRSLGCPGMDRSAMWLSMMRATSCSSVLPMGNSDRNTHVCLTPCHCHRWCSIQPDQSAVASIVNTMLTRLAVHGGATVD
jgi:hypothetical protein